MWGAAVMVPGGTPQNGWGRWFEGHQGLGGYRGWGWGGEPRAGPVALWGKAPLGCLRGLYRALQT